MPDSERYVPGSMEVDGEQEGESNGAEKGNKATFYVYAKPVDGSSSESEPEPDADADQVDRKKTHGNSKHSNGQSSEGPNLNKQLNAFEEIIIDDTIPHPDQTSDGPQTDPNASNATSNQNKRNFHSKSTAPPPADEKDPTKVHTKSRKTPISGLLHKAGSDSEEEAENVQLPTFDSIGDAIKKPGVPNRPEESHTSAW